MLFTPGDIVYSSSGIIETAAARRSRPRSCSRCWKPRGFDFDSLRGALAKLAGIRVHVVGDTIVDSYTHTTMIGGMTKTPTMSVRFENRKDFVGGAGIVAKHLQAAGADVTLLDRARRRRARGVRAQGPGSRGRATVMPIIDRTRPTTNKNAIVAGGYNLLKVDTLDNRSISERIVRTLSKQIVDTSDRHRRVQRFPPRHLQPRHHSAR